MDHRVNPRLLIAAGIGFTSFATLIFFFGAMSILTKDDQVTYVFVANLVVFLGVFYVAPITSLAFHSLVDTAETVRIARLAETKSVVRLLRSLLVPICVVLLALNQSMLSRTVLLYSILWLVLVQHAAFCRGVLLGERNWSGVFQLLGVDGLAKCIATAVIVLAPIQSLEFIFLILVISCLPVSAVGHYLVSNTAQLSNHERAGFKISRTTVSRYTVAVFSSLTIQTHISIPLIFASLQFDATTNFVPLVVAFTVSRIPLSFASSFVLPAVVEFSEFHAGRPSTDRFMSGMSSQIILRAVRRLLILGSISLGTTFLVVSIHYQLPILLSVSFAIALSFSGTAVSLNELFSAIAVVGSQNRLALLQWIVAFASLTLAFVLVPIRGEALVLIAVTVSGLSSLAMCSWSIRGMWRSKDE